MRVFAGKLSMLQRSHSRLVYLSWRVLAIIEHNSSGQNLIFAYKGL
jgi:hypothetical protein